MAFDKTALVDTTMSNLSDEIVSASADKRWQMTSNASMNNFSYSHNYEENNMIRNVLPRTSNTNGCDDNENNLYVIDTHSTNYDQCRVKNRQTVNLPVDGISLLDDKTRNSNWPTQIFRDNEIIPSSSINNCIKNCDTTLKNVTNSSYYCRPILRDYTLSKFFPNEAALNSLLMEAEQGFMMVLKCVDGRIDFVSDNVVDCIGQLPRQMEGILIYNFLHPEDHNMFNSNISQVVSFNSHFNLRMLRCQNDANTFQYELLVMRLINPEQQDVGGSPVVIVMAHPNRNKSMMPNVFKQEQNFTVQLDPHTFRIIHIDVGKVQSFGTANILESLQGCYFHNFCHSHDTRILENHLMATLSDGGDVSDVYRLSLYQYSNEYQLKVRSRSRYFQSNISDGSKTVVISTLWILDEKMINGDDWKTASTGKMENAVSCISTNINNPNNNNISFHPENEKFSSTDQKNTLLKQLLNVNYNIDTISGGDNNSNNIKSSSSTIVQRLSNSHPEILPTNSISVGVKRPYNLNFGKRGLKPQNVGSALCSQNPALATLLAKPPQPTVIVPPPVPTKWHQEPKEKLPRDIMRKFLPPHPADRCPPTPLQTRFTSQENAPLCPDDVLSDILDEVIDIQETHPLSHHQSSLDPHFDSENICDIKRFLSSDCLRAQPRTRYIIDEAMTSPPNITLGVGGRKPAFVSRPVAYDVHLGTSSSWHPGSSYDSVATYTINNGYVQENEVSENQSLLQKLLTE